MKTIARAIEELQTVIRQQYGLETYVLVHIYDHWEENEHISGQGQAATQIALAMGRKFDEKTVIECHSSGDSDWVNVVPAYERNCRITLFY